LNAAVRATSYSTSGYVTTWKVGATYQPIDDIRFRATRRATSARRTWANCSPAGTGTGNSVNDPFNNGNTTT
jgi:iron complex outermembrane receptor protein